MARKKTTGARYVKTLELLARELEITKQAAHKFEKSGVFEREPNGSFDVGKNLTRYVELVNPGQQRPLSKGAMQVPVKKLTERYLEARASKEESLAGKAKLELQELEGQMLRADVIKPLYANVLTMLKNNCLAVSRRVSTSLVGLTSAEEIGDKIYQEIEIALHSVRQDAFKGHLKLRKG